MNHIYRLVWNRATGTRHAVSELARASSPGSGSVARCAVVASFALVLSPAWANGGASGAADGGDTSCFTPSVAGATPQQPVGSDGVNGTTTCGSFSGGSGGAGGSTSNVTGAGGAGGGGGAGWLSTDGTRPGGIAGSGGTAALATGVFANTLDQVGGAGGNGGDAPGAVILGGSGGGGGGGFGWVLSSPGNSSNSARVVGGAGGAGGATRFGGGGGGGQGGVGTLSTAGGRIDNTGQLMGGMGGAGGPSVFYVGSGGDGGDGILITQGGVLVNRGEVRGGNGGAAGAQSFDPLMGAPGLGGVGVNYTGNNGSIVNSGMIAGGLSGSGAQADAIRMTGNNNVLELQSGYAVVGNVIASGTGNRLALGGAGNGSFNAGSIGATAQYRGFTQFQKTGTSTWTLTGSTTETTPWTLAGGTLSVASDASLGASAGTLTLQGGVLQTTASFSSARAVRLLVAGSGIDTASGTTLTLAGAMSGAAPWSKTGAGTLLLTGANTATGAATIAAGTLQVGNGGTTGSLGTGAVTNNAALIFNRSNTLVVGGAISGTGTLTQAGTGTTVLSGANTYTGATTISAGTLQIGNGGTTGSLGTGAVTNNASLVFNRSNNLVVRNVITGTGTLTQAGTGNTALSGNNTYTGVTTISGGTLQLGNGGTTGSLGTGAVINNAGLVFNRGNTMVVNNAISGTGTVLQATGATTVLTGANTYAGRTTIAAGTLQIGNGGTTGSLGSGAVNNNAALVFNRGDTLVVGNAISGTGRLTQAGTGTTVLTGANSYAGVTTVSAGTLQIGNGGTTGSLGTGAVTNNAALVFNRSNTVVLGNLISGTGSLTQAGTGTTVLTGANTYTGATAISAGTLQIGNGGAVGSLGTGPVTNNAALVFNRSNNLVLGNAITGTGSLTQAGTGTLVLTGDNSYSGATTVSAGTLQVGNGGTTGSLGTGPVINNAALVFNRSNTLIANGAIGGTGTVTQAGSGTLLLTADNTYTGATTISAGTLQIGNGGTTGSLGIGPVINNAALVFNRSNTLVSIGAISGTGTLTQAGSGTLLLTADNTYSGATTISAGTLQLGNGGTTGSLGTGAVTNNGALVFNRNNNAIVGSAISGTGSVTQAGTGTTVLNGANSYTGATNVSAGTLRAGSANAFGASSLYSVSSGALLDLNGFDHTVNALAGSGAVDLGSAKLSVGVADPNASASFFGAISGTGSLTKTGSGSLTLGGASSYSGGTALKGGRIDIGHTDALGTGALAMDDGTTLGFAADGLTLANAIQLTGSNDPVIDTDIFSETLAGGISGGGFLTKLGSGTLTLAAANNNYTGATNVAAGTLRAGVANAFSAASQHTVAAGATLDTGGFNQTLAGLANSGTVSLLGASPGSTLTVTGPYVGNGGVLRLGTALGTSASVSDRMVLSGSSAVASGTTTLQITNLGGLGGFTTGNGIEVIGTANGGSLAAGAFTLANGHVDAGAFEYRLSSSVGGAYLSNLAPVIPPATPAAPVTPAAVPEVLASPPAAPAIGLPLYRAEVPLFAALPEQLRQANLAMIGNLALRQGDDDIKMAAGPTVADGERRAWGRVLSIDPDIRQTGTVSPSSQGRLAGFQAGTDLLAAAQWRAGVYVGQLEGDVQVRGFARGVMNLGAGRNDLRNQYLGAYGTWKNVEGLYVDGVLQAGRHRYDVNPSNASATTAGKGRSLLASIEVGQAFALGGIGSRWQIEPQLQLVHQRLSMDDATLVGATVRQNADNGWLLRAGLRVKGEISTPVGAMQPYARLNVYRRGSGTDVASFVGPAATIDIATRNGGTSSELAAGATLALNERISVYGEVGKLWASGGSAKVASSVQGSLGVRVKW
ncbi:MAG: autotransporter-associated beta strand repeat-containing protein [Gammaproteobacteria bacterium]|nr:autotransporter-associated beta strand repeat-containing protein [Gammaproteobacteria bacterium]